MNSTLKSVLAMTADQRMEFADLLYRLDPEAALDLANCIEIQSMDTVYAQITEDPEYA